MRIYLLDQNTELGLVKYDQAHNFLEVRLHPEFKSKYFQSFLILLEFINKKGDFKAKIDQSELIVDKCNDDFLLTLKQSLFLNLNLILK